MHWIAPVALSAAFAYGWSPRLSPLISFPAATVIHILFFKAMARLVDWMPTWSIVLLAFRETVLAAIQLCFVQTYLTVGFAPVSFSIENVFYLDNVYWSTFDATAALAFSFVFLLALSIHTLIQRAKLSQPFVSFSLTQIVVVVLALTLPLYLASSSKYGYGWPFIAVNYDGLGDVYWVLALDMFFVLAPCAIYLVLNGNKALREPRFATVAKVLAMFVVVIFFANESLVRTPKINPTMWGWPFYFRMTDHEILRVLCVDLYYLGIYCFAIFNIRPNSTEMSAAAG